MRSLACILASALLAACNDGHATASADDTSAAADAGDVGEGTSAADGGSSDDGPHSDPPGVDACNEESYAIYVALAKSCDGCHGEGTNFPAFASFESFESLIVADASLVVPGDADASELLALLAGEADPPLRQMPPGASSFVDLEADGMTDVGMDELRAWIDGIAPCDPPSDPGSPRFARRVEAEHVRAMLFAQLGLTLADVAHVSYFPIDDPTFGTMTPADNSNRDAEARWAALGGPNLLTGNLRVSAWSPLFLQTVGPMGQAWCRRSIQLDRDALFRDASVDTTDVGAIKANIAYLHLRMLGVVASSAEVDAMYDGVYRHYADTEDTATAWTAVCSALVRDPLWLTL